MSVSPSTRRTRSSTSRTNSPPTPVGSGRTLRHVTVQRRSSPVEDEVSPSSSAGDAVAKILKARKCWRSIKGKEEAVWPPELEAALIEGSLLRCSHGAKKFSKLFAGLEKYRPAESKSTRVLGRFPMRNKFVADHIFETTGVRRTPKQVGSRIQQLRDTNSGKHSKCSLSQSTCSFLDWPIVQS